MGNVKRMLQVPFTVQQMYDLINDIEAYPQFLPWCKTTTVHSRADTELEATLCIAKGPISHTITTLNTMQPHQIINMQYKAGPFKSCVSSWQFITNAQGTGCTVVFEINYEFKSKLSALTLEPVFQPITNTLIDAFYQRAVTIYGR
jgi:ribosome-associated toxin RatA of RatAB toxin-antitoxin module